jgi:hypothetical protein
MNGFSPVWERRCERRAKREVCSFPRRGQPVHSHTYFAFVFPIWPWGSRSVRLSRYSNIWMNGCTLTVMDMFDHGLEFPKLFSAVEPFAGDERDVKVVFVDLAVGRPELVLFCRRGTDTGLGRGNGATPLWWHCGCWGMLTGEGRRRRRGTRSLGRTSTLSLSP